MSINRNVLVPIPDQANHPKTGRRVFLTLEKRYDPVKKYNKDKRIAIGEACSDTQMYPNDSYKLLFPDTYNKCAPYEQHLPALTKIIGPYAAFLALGISSGIYDVINKSFGPLYANMIMDYAMYSILMESDVSSEFQNTMKNYLLFSEKTYSDTWISDFFKNKITDNQSDLFRRNWAEHCKKNQVDSVWLCVDGSNDDCDAQKVWSGEAGHDKSGNGGPIVSYMWAVSAKDGTPITYRVYRGSRVDSQELKEIVSFLSDYGITTKGIILDRGFWNVDDVKALQGAGYDFLIMMKSGVGFDTMLKNHGALLRSGNVANMLTKSGMYGITDQVQVFSTMSEKFYVTLFFNNRKWAKKTNELTDAVKRAIRDARQKVSEHQAYTLPKEAKPYIIVEKHRGRNGDTFQIDEEALQKEVDSKGFASIASSKQCTPEEVDQIYQLRQASEKQYSTFKSQLGFDVLRVHTESSWESKFAVGFIAGLLRNELQKVCAGMDIDVSTALRELSFIMMTRMKDDRYLYIHMMTIRAQAILQQLGLIEDDMALIAEEENRRLDGEKHSPIHTLPVRETVKRKPGRPPGSKNKKGTKPKKAGTGRRGRPPGSKNKKTIEREKREAEEAAKKATEAQTQKAEASAK